MLITFTVRLYQSQFMKQFSLHLLRVGWYRRLIVVTIAILALPNDCFQFPTYIMHRQFLFYLPQYIKPKNVHVLYVKYPYLSHFKTKLSEHAPTYLMQLLRQPQVFPPSPYCTINTLTSLRNAKNRDNRYFCKKKNSMWEPYYFCFPRFKI